MRALNTIKIIFRTRTKENVDDKSSFLSLSSSSSSSSSSSFPSATFLWEFINCAYDLEKRYYSDLVVRSARRRRASDSRVNARYSSRTFAFEHFDSFSFFFSFFFPSDDPRTLKRM